MTQQVEKLSETNKSLAQKIKKFLSDLLAKVKEIYSRLLADSEESKIVGQMSDTLSDIMDKWSQGIINASKNADTVTGKSQTKNTANNDGVKKSDRITINMSGKERTEILKTKTLLNLPVAKKSDLVVSWSDIDNLSGKEKRSFIQKIAREFGVFKEYTASDIKLVFNYSNNNYNESYNKQKKNYQQFAKMFSVFDEVIENAVGIEVHNRNDYYKPDPTLENVYVLFSAFEDGENIIPVKLEIKEFKDKPNTLHVAVSLEAIKKTEVWEQGTTENGVAQNSRSVTYSICDLFKKINPKDIDFIKYLPDEILTDKQLKAKHDYLDKKYLEAVNNGDMKTAQQMVDKAAKDAGHSVRAYHGTEREFTKYEYGHDRKSYSIGKNMGEGFYFATDKEVAEIYANGKDDGVLCSYLKIENPFKLYGTEFGYSDLKELSKTAGYEINKANVKEYLQSRGYDGIINFEFNGKVRAYLVYNSEQIKSADPVTYDDNGDVIPLSKRFDEQNTDIRYSKRDYSYEGLVNKPNMKVTIVNDSVSYDVNAQNRKNVVNQSLLNVASVGKVNKNGAKTVFVRDIDKNIIVSRKSIEHGLDRRLKISAPVLLNIGNILENSIIINELTPKQDSAVGSYVLVGYAQGNENSYIVRSVVNQYTGELDSVDVLYAINTKKETAGKMPGSHGNTALPTVSTISISELLDLVNKYFPDILPEDVLKHYGYDSRPEGDLKDNVLYQPRPSIDDFLFDDEYSELTDNDAYLIGQYITGDALTVNHLINNTRKTELSDSALNHIVSKLVKSYNLDGSNNKDISIALLSYIFYIY